ncbi:MAG TPA: hypothetical protein VN706_17050 [Gemmatimonadaceae bacterium]|nr:hypothetical protein [Gemmatimonadaceae bacterium]
MSLVQNALILALLTAIPLHAVAAQHAAPAATITPAARLAVLGDSLTPGASRTAQLGLGPNMTYALTHRDSTGGLEAHRDWTDVFVVESGSATLVSGGTLSGAKEATPGEWRGGKANGSTRAALHVGDVVVIPAGAPHQMILAPGEHITYLAFKVKAP